MTGRRVDGDYRRALDHFCGELRKLRAEAGLSVDKLLSTTVTSPLGVKRSQLYQVLGGRIVEPPAWDFVQNTVVRCAAHAGNTSRPLSVSTDLAYWRRQHGRLAELFQSGGDVSPARAEQVLARSARSPQVLTVQEVVLRQVPASSARRIGVITADLRQVRCAEIWVNSENTEMVMPRIQEFSTSAIIRYEGSQRDAAGRVIVDTIAEELEMQVAPLRPVGAGEVFVTGAGALRERNGVRYVIHAAAVQGEPGAGFRPVAQLGRCVENALSAAEKLDVDAAAGTTILFPLFGAGVGHGDLPATATTLLHAAINYLRTAPDTRIGTVLFLAYTDVELEACLAALDEVKDLKPG